MGFKDKIRYYRTRMGKIFLLLLLIQHDHEAFPGDKTENNQHSYPCVYENKEEKIKEEVAFGLLLFCCPKA